FEALLVENDRDLLGWFTGELPVPAQHDTALFADIVAHREAKSRGDRA
ncbi:MAG: succinate dehydrogenase assembly factor 2, partial [Pseudomonadota bacterium]|nr:succinate dehydrogenase assembly factor 2 [Pseudomonadota bacterium]